MKQPKLLSLLFVATLLVSLLLVVGTAQTPVEPEKMTGQAITPADRVTTSPHEASSQETSSLTPIVRQAIKHDQSPPLRSIPPGPPSKGEGRPGPNRIEIPRFPLPGREGSGKNNTSHHTLDPSVQDWHGSPQMPSPILHFEGLGNDDNLTVVRRLVVPPDTQGDVGPSHYVQWVNLVFAIWDKSANLLYGPVTGNTLWTGFGGPCENTNSGDPITLYDPLANRWFMSQFALPNSLDGPFYQCIAVSESDDPTGSWYRYAYKWENGLGQDVMNDYPKFGVWPDGYYMTANQFAPGGSQWAGTGVAAFERAEMLEGRTARMVYFDLGPSDWGGMLPSDLDGPAPPPAGAPNPFVEVNAGEWQPGLNDELLIYEFHADWTDPPSSTFTRVATLPTVPFDGDMCGFSQDCIPQPGTTQKLDAIADRLMYRLQYRNFGSYETLVTNLTVDADGTDHAGVRWFELRKTGTAWSIYQQGTYAPDADHRWMGSIAMDRAGNIALGYSVSSHSTYPSIRYAGRLAGDPLGTLPLAETELATGRSFQAGKNRWGDYSMMALDPVDDCTFWYTQEYVLFPGSWGNWNTRIGSFRFPGGLEPAYLPMVFQSYTVTNDAFDRAETPD